MKRTLGTCYYPEHWDEAIWAQDAARMVELGLTWVRIGEFAWSRIEPAPGTFDWGWLDRAMDVLGNAGLRVVLGTPTATPPRWVADKYPDMFALDAEGRVRGFGSRRHYCFSHEGYRAECARIVEAVAERYGAHPALAAWQTDNEYGCHDTTISYSPAAREAFQGWLRGQYPGAGNDGDIGALNRAWGNVFWSMEYDSFEQIGLPNLTVTEPNPSHALAFRRFSSDQVVSFNALQCEIIRRYSDAPISHNYMGRITDFDHFAVGEDMEIATWDSYPLGFLEDRVGASVDVQRAFSKQGDPDFQAFHHDLYRAVGKGRWWVMEQQPGPVNWAPHNPAPLPGMVRLWTWEAFAHGAEAVCYFRWRQAPFAQEQLHAGLLRPDSAEAAGMAEARSVAQELAEAPDVGGAQAPVALIFDYDADAAWAVQPQGNGADGAGLSYFALVFDFYRALRRLGLSVDIVSPETRDFAGYRLILAPGMMHMDEGLKTALSAGSAKVLVGPRGACKTFDMAIPVPLPPALPGLDAEVSYVETLRGDCPIALENGGSFVHWRDAMEGSARVLERDANGAPAVMQGGVWRYVAGWPDAEAVLRIVWDACTDAGVEVEPMPGALRRRETGSEVFWFNYAAEEVHHEGRIFGPASVTRDTL
ncbi:beta-galactosidase [Alphaproteobacteria bacterium KMM 3653]|uniref:Beta-galactosidase n=1 Tax=Harenicola maris TaxID=2841044 RepID=A0AAP2CQ63_9RHOB|nr:beta-galactosidase [Harenicola maris]